MDLTNPQWEVIEKLLSKRKKKDDRGRPHQNIRSVMNGIFWICSTGARWQDMPKVYPPYQTCHRYFQYWVRSGTWDKILWHIALDLKERGKIDITECFIDGTFASAKKGALVLEKLNEVRGQRSWRLQTLLAFLSPYGPEQQTDMSRNTFRMLFRLG